MMKRPFHVAVLAIIAVAAVAQAPKGWKMRVDESTSAADPDGSGPVSLVAMGSGYHAINPQAAVYWNPANTAKGTYTLKGSFTLTKPSSHPNYYGLMFGGSNLDGPQQKYLYFVVAQNGTWLIKHRSGDGATENVSSKERSDAVKKPDASGKCTNDLEVRVGADKIDYVVNGTVVHSTPKTGATANTDGIYGMRVNHVLDVMVDGLSLSK